MENTARRDIPGYQPAPWRPVADLAEQLGFVAFGVAAAGRVPVSAEAAFSSWTARKYHSEMAYLERYDHQRLDTTHPAILDGAVTVASVALPIGKGATTRGFFSHVAAHARARDYHRTIKGRLHALARGIQQLFPRSAYRVFVDSAPVMERTWATLSGIGSILKNGAISVDGVGPCVLLGEMVLSNVPRPPHHEPPPPFAACGSCNLCIDSCPTGALEAPGIINSKYCLSYWSIERKNRPVPKLIAERVTSIFGCDICTTVCPLNTDRLTCGLEPPPQLRKSIPSLRALPKINPIELETIIAGTPLTRAGAKNLVDNARMVIRNVD